MNPPARICIIGIDGATFDLINPWMEAGLLPHFKRIVSSGVSGPLRSSIPDNSAPAWTSIVTGKNPGKHRVFGFVAPDRDISRMKITNSLTRACPSLWNIFSKNEQNVCVVNVPLTYPPEEVRGVMISGMDTPNTETAYTHPAALKQELTERFGRYLIEPERAGLWTALSERGKRSYLDEVHAITRLRCQVITWLLSRQPWDFFMAVFVATDRIQHKFWHEMDGGHPLAESRHPKVRNAVLDTYRLVDACIGEISSALSEDTTLFIVSDHGFGFRSPNVVSVNRYLARHGFLTYRKAGKTMPAVDGLRRAARLFVEFLRAMASPRCQQNLKRIFPFLKGAVFSYLTFGGIDWSRTKAFADEPMGLIWINRTDRFQNGLVNPGREYEATRDEIVRLLRDLKDPGTNRCILKSVQVREDVYAGPFLCEAPDIVFAYSEEYSFPEHRNQERLFADGAFLGTVKHIRELMQISGIHRPKGIFMAVGPRIRRNVRLSDAGVEDIAPTCLHLAGLPVDRDMDGRVLTEAFQETFLAERPVVYETPAAVRTGETNGTNVYSADESREIQDRLKDLGYL